MSNKITAADFKIFKKAVYYWQKKLNLQEWELAVSLDKISKDNRAEIICNFPGMIASISLGKTWNMTSTKADLEKCALHEVLELLLMDLQDMAFTTYSTLKVTNAAHTIIRKLEHTFYPAI